MRGSPCRKHPCSWWHAELVDGYRSAVRAQEQRAEAATAGYRTELSDYYATVEPRLTFRYWLANHRTERP